MYESPSRVLRGIRTLTPRAGLMHWPAPMTRDGKADKGHDWLDTWKAMEDLHLAYPEKLKAIGKIKPSLRTYITHIFC